MKKIIVTGIEEMRDFFLSRIGEVASIDPPLAYAALVLSKYTIRFDLQKRIDDDIPEAPKKTIVMYNDELEKIEKKL